MKTVLDIVFVAAFSLLGVASLVNAIRKRNFAILLIALACLGMILCFFVGKANGQEITHVPLTINCINGQNIRFSSNDLYKFITGLSNNYCLTNPNDGSLMDANGRYIIEPHLVRLPCEISYSLTTNWTTVSIVTPASPYGGWIGNRSLNQIGSVSSNTVGTITWHGKTIPVTLESVEILQTNRTVPDTGYSNLINVNSGIVVSNTPL